MLPRPSPQGERGQDPALGGFDGCPNNSSCPPFPAPEVPALWVQLGETPDPPVLSLWTLEQGHAGLVGTRCLSQDPTGLQEHRSPHWWKGHPGKGTGSGYAGPQDKDSTISVYLLGASWLWAAGSAQELDVGLRPTHTFLQSCKVETSRFCAASAAVTWLVQASFAQDLPT